jgi:hypothetical protein
LPRHGDAALSSVAANQKPLRIAIDFPHERQFLGLPASKRVRCASESGPPKRIVSDSARRV